MRLDIFSIPIFVDKVDLDKIDITEDKFEEYWLSKTPTSMPCDVKISPSTFEYLSTIVARNIDELGPYANPRFGQIWRNKYSKTDYQDSHIHPRSQWSFIIYETVKESKTNFINPSRSLIINQLEFYPEHLPTEFTPTLGPGDMLIFPSFLEHFVLAGNEGTTISGNVYLDPPPIDK
jgi:hypothetical protein